MVKAKFAGAAGIAGNAGHPPRGIGEGTGWVGIPSVLGGVAFRVWATPPSTESCMTRMLGRYLRAASN